jgi:hypothetical protein
MKLLFGLSGLGAAGVVAIAVMGGAGCTAAATDSPSEAGVTSTMEAGADAADAAVADAAAEAEPSPFVPPDNSYYIRFVLATSDFSPGQPFDICFAPWDGNPVNAPADSAYIGPIGDLFGAQLTAPEVLNYYKLPSNQLPTGGPIALRLVNANQGSCAGTQRFTISGTAAVLKVDDSVTPVVKGYNTAVIYGNVNNVSNLKLSAHVDADPSTAPTAPTLQFFNGFGAGGTSLSISLTDVNDKVYTPSSGGTVPYGQYTTIAFSNGTEAVNMKKLTLTPDVASGAAPVDVMLGVSLTPGYYPAFAYGITAAEGWICDDATTVIAGASTVVASGCHH